MGKFELRSTFQQGVMNVVRNFTRCPFQCFFFFAEDQILLKTMDCYNSKGLSLRTNTLSLVDATELNSVPLQVPFPIVSCFAETHSVSFCSETVVYSKALLLHKTKQPTPTPQNWMQPLIGNTKFHPNPLDGYGEIVSNRTSV